LTYTFKIYILKVYKEVGMPKENKTRCAILGLLSRAPLSGYDIKKLIDLSISYFWNENFGHLYAVLRQMEREGLITRQVMQTPGRPDRSVFSLTDEGRTALSDWLVREPEDPPTRIELLLQLFFAGSLPVSVIIEKIKKEKEINEGLLADYNRIRQNITKYNPDTYQGNVPNWLMTLSFGEHRSRAAVAWCDETMDMLARLQAVRETGQGEPK
jgi:PadR family transcriptional regulator, regulatory protein AphA